MFIVQGVAEMILRDVRAGMPARTMRFIVDGDNHRSSNNVGVVIPPGVAHAIRVEGSEDLIMVYGTSTSFRPEFEGRIASRGGDGGAAGILAALPRAVASRNERRGSSKPARAGADGSSGCDAGGAGSGAAKPARTESLLRQLRVVMRFLAALDQTRQTDCGCSISRPARRTFRGWWRTTRARSARRSRSWQSISSRRRWRWRDG